MPLSPQVPVDGSEAWHAGEGRPRPARGLGVCGDAAAAARLLVFAFLVPSAPRRVTATGDERSVGVAPLPGLAVGPAGAIDRWVVGLGTQRLLGVTLGVPGGMRILIPRDVDRAI